MYIFGFFIIQANEGDGKRKEVDPENQAGVLEGYLKFKFI